MTVVHEEPIVLRYSNYGSYLTLCVYILMIVLTIIITFLIAFFTGGFWEKYSTFIEIPNVTFENKIFFEALIQQNNSTELLQRFWSSNEQVNNLFADKLLFPVYSLKTLTLSESITTLNPTHKTYRNMDPNVVDLFFFNLKVPLQANQEIIGVRLLLFFNVQFSEERQVRVEAVAHLQHASPFPGQQVNFYGNLIFKQNMPLVRRYGVRNSMVNESNLIDFSSITSLGQLDLNNIFNEALNSEMSASFVPTNVYWKPKLSLLAITPNDKLFELKATIKVPAQIIWFEPGVLQVLKLAWVQYLAVLVVIAFIFQKIFRYFIISGLLQTRQISSKKLM